MRRNFVAVIAVYAAVAVCCGCSTAPEAGNGEAVQQSAKEQEAQEKKSELTEEQVAEITTQFAGISVEHATDMWKAREKADEASDLIAAYWEQRSRFSKNDQNLLSAAIRTAKEARTLLEPLCRRYPHNDALNSLTDVIVQGLRSLEAQKK